ncbi:unnamed protein product [Phytophthora fragariaefolia]|uniref:Unnamed protein product n=1 Tax=Phytophthora fragariaefolia TaxID=1490495 RepID=A0A9W6X825_9STRA|nr:unnamed protein product [Phytophthora fragariaefolia]
MARRGSNQDEDDAEEQAQDLLPTRRGSKAEQIDEEVEDDDDDAELDEEEAARQEARRLRTAIAEASEARDELQQRNTKCVRGPGAAAAAGGDATAGAPIAAGRREDKASASENAKRYLECLRSVHEAKVQMVMAQAQYDKVALELQARLDEKEAKVTEIQDAFLEFKREVARNAENLRTGKPIAKRVITQFEAAELRKDQEVEKVRLKHINLRTHLKKLEQQLHAKEQLAEGLHLIDFEQLKIENQTLNEKIEERNEELHKLRKKTTSTVQVLTHIKEKLQFVLAENQMLKRDSQDLEEALTANRDQLAHKKKDRDAARQLAARLKSKEGFAKSELLIEDFEKRENDLVDLERRRAELIQRHALLTKQIKQGGKTDKLLTVWLVMGVLPLCLQTRSYLQVVKPHKIPEELVIPPDLQRETTNLTEVCPVTAFVLAGVWWNYEATHYYNADQGIVCHAVVPQYNLHGNYVIGSSKTTPYRSTPSSCANDSYPIQQYLYHGSIGYYSFYQGEVGTYCAESKTAYMVVEVLGSFDINGVVLAEDTGSTQWRMSYWYSTLGAMWLAYRAVIIRRSYVSFMHYGHTCDEMHENLRQRDAMVFVQESMRLSAHGASTYQRTAILVLVVEGIMVDLFLIIAYDGWRARVQYASLGFNLSGLMLLLFEILDSTHLLNPRWRLCIKRVFFSYETTLVGELVSAFVFQAVLSGLNGSDLKRSKPTALAVSYYFWSLVCHGLVVLVVVSLISAARVIWSLSFVWLKYRSFALLSESCCIDTALGLRNRSTLLRGYHFEDGEWYYTVSALKAFGLLNIEEDGVEYLVIQKLHWITMPRHNFVAIGIISNQRVEPCNERPCSGMASFLDRKLGGVSIATTSHYSPNTRGSRVMAWSGPPLA